MKFWDASAVVPLLMGEASTAHLMALVKVDSSMLVWWGTPVECASAVARLERDTSLDASGAAQAFRRLNDLAQGWHEIDPSDAVRETAIRFLRVHHLRAADALQLAAAFVAAEGRPSALAVITLDDRLASAARKEGFTLVDVPPDE